MEERRGGGGERREMGSREIQDLAEVQRYAALGQYVGWSKHRLLEFSSRMPDVNM